MSELWEWSFVTTCSTRSSPLLGIHISGAGSYTGSRSLVTEDGLVDWPSECIPGGFVDYTYFEIGNDRSLTDP